MQRFECYFRSGDCSCLFPGREEGRDHEGSLGKVMCYLIENNELVLVSSALQSVIWLLKLLVYLLMLDLYALKR